MCIGLSVQCQCNTCMPTKCLCLRLSTCYMEGAGEELLQLQTVGLRANEVQYQLVLENLNQFPKLITVQLHHYRVQSAQEDVYFNSLFKYDIIVLYGGEKSSSKLPGTLESIPANLIYSQVQILLACTRKGNFSSSSGCSGCTLASVMVWNLKGRAQDKEKRNGEQLLGCIAEISLAEV